MMYEGNITATLMDDDDCVLLSCGTTSDLQILNRLQMELYAARQELLSVRRVS